ncbi:hypothetical protein T484DRAFT_1883537, partial [Baffinella frigidus]
MKSLGKSAKPPAPQLNQPSETRLKVERQLQERQQLQLQEHERRLDFLVARALDVSNLTGEVIICKHQDDLGDAGVQRVALRLGDYNHISSLSIENHDIRVAGATALAAGLLGNKHLSRLSLRQNRIESEGANALVGVLKSFGGLVSLDLSDNRIGPLFIQGLVQCAWLQTISLQHNLLEVTSLTTDALLRRLLSHLVKLFSDLGQGNLEAAVMPHSVLRSQNDPSSKNFGGQVRYSPLNEMELRLPDRWGLEPSFVANLFQQYTSVQSLNGLFEFPVPPLVQSHTWDITGYAMRFPLYEAQHVANRLRAAPVPVTVLLLAWADLRGKAALALADALPGCAAMVALDLEGCLLDSPGITALAHAVRSMPSLSELNHLRAPIPMREASVHGGSDTQSASGMGRMPSRGRAPSSSHLSARSPSSCLISPINPFGISPRGAAAEPIAGVEGAEEASSSPVEAKKEYLYGTFWDLAGQISNQIEASFVADNPLSLEQGAMIAEAIGGALDENAQETLEEINGWTAGSGERQIRLRKRLLHDPDVGIEARLPHELGLLSLDLKFLQVRLANYKVLQELDLSENALGDSGAELLSRVLVIEGISLSLRELHLNQNFFTAA